MQLSRPAIPASLALVLSASLAFPAFGYIYPLSSTAIREATLRAQETNSRTIDFLEQYTHSFPEKSGPYVGAISVVTPYMEVYRRAGQGLGYTTLDAQQEFLGKPGNFQVEVMIQNLPTGFATTLAQGVVLTVPDTWHDYKIEVAQDSKRIEPKKTTAALMLSDYTPSIAGAGIVGVIVTLDFNPEEVDSASTDISVTGPDGAEVQTTFDLARLR